MFVSFPPEKPQARLWGHDRACVEIGGGTAIILADAAECDALIAAAVEAKQLLDPPKPPAVMCECGHFEAYHVGAVLGDEQPGQCTAMVDDGGDCECERYGPAAGQGGVLFPAGAAAAAVSA